MLVLSSFIFFFTSKAVIEIDLSVGKEGRMLVLNLFDIDFEFTLHLEHRMSRIQTQVLHPQLKNQEKDAGIELDIGLEFTLNLAHRMRIRRIQTQVLHLQLTNKIGLRVHAPFLSTINEPRAKKTSFRILKKIANLSNFKSKKTNIFLCSSY